MKKLLLVYNPHSGKGELKLALSDVISVFTQAGYDVTVHPTCASSDGQDYIMRRGNEYDLIVCSGGDGMLHELVCAMSAIGADKQCGYIPSGTVNDFASSLKIPKKPVEAAKMIVNGNYKKIDVGSFNDDKFAYVAAFGMFTQVSYATDQKIKNALGATAYLLEIMKGMDVWNFMHSSAYAEIVFNDTVVKGNFIFGMVGNTLSVAGVKNLVPIGASMNDGLLDGMFIKTPQTIAEAEAIKKALVTQKYDIPGIICAKSDRFVIHSKTEIPWTLDGEFGGNHCKADITIRKQILNIAVP